MNVFTSPDFLESFDFGSVFAFDCSFLGSVFCVSFGFSVVVLSTISPCSLSVCVNDFCVSCVSGCSFLVSFLDYFLVYLFVSFIVYF